jgi:hypothetical protein
MSNAESYRNVSMFFFLLSAAIGIIWAVAAVRLRRQSEAVVAEDSRREVESKDINEFYYSLLKYPLAISLLSLVMWVLLSQALQKTKDQGPPLPPLRAKIGKG